jgi:hydroxyacylglutathione hydrolase
VPLPSCGILHSMRVWLVPCLTDNYAYLVAADGSPRAAVVDPAEAEPVERELATHGLELAEVWLTHHHWDHVGGVEALGAARPELVVRGGRYDGDQNRLPAQTRAHGDGDTFAFDGEEVRVMEIPGHTLGHIAYVAEGHLFCGDMLFLGGCGRVFEGTMAMMKDSLSRLRALPAETRVYCGHEYTVRNLEYARTGEPASEAVAEALAEAKRRRALGEPTIPGTIGTEKRVNPFFRFDVPDVAAGRDSVATFTALREGKDRF